LLQQKAKCLNPTMPSSEERFTVHTGEDAIIVSFRAPTRVLSWALLNGSFCYADHIVNHHVRGDDFRFCADPRSWLAAAVENLALDGKAVAMATAVLMKIHAQVSFASPNTQVTCLATVGCGNALAAGDPTSATITEPAQLHTINLIVVVQPALSDAAMVEAIQIATEGRARALFEAEVRSSVSNLPASGTGTDCIAIASVGTGPGAQYCGKHTELGELIGRAAYAAVQQGLMRSSVRNHSANGGPADDS
jgi:adenosylcobinamide amidohydrolase